MNTNIKFVKAKDPDDDFEYSPDKRIDSFYQICQNKKNGSITHETRKVYFNERTNIIKVFERKYTTKVIKKFLSNTSNTKYKVYPTNSLEYIGLPNAAELTQASSPMAN